MEFPWSSDFPHYSALTGIIEMWIFIKKQLPGYYPSRRTVKLEQVLLQTGLGVARKIGTVVSDRQNC
jgi:hypothetical protein